MTESIAAALVADRLAQEDRVGAQAGHAAPAVAGVGHDRREAEHAVLVPGGHRLGDHPAHRDADDVRAVDAEVVEHADAVVGHVAEGVGRARLVAQEELLDGRRAVVLEVGRAADVAVVVADDEVAAGGELLAERVGPAEHLRAEAHHQQHRRVRRVPERLEADLEVVADGRDLLSHGPLTLPRPRGAESGFLQRGGHERRVVAALEIAERVARVAQEVGVGEGERGAAGEQLGVLAPASPRRAPSPRR